MLVRLHVREDSREDSIVNYVDASYIKMVKPWDDNGCKVLVIVEGMAEQFICNECATDVAEKVNEALNGNSKNNRD